MNFTPQLVSSRLAKFKGSRADNENTLALRMRASQRATGERRLVVVELSDAERLDALRALAVRPGACGGPDGLIVRGYALRRAENIAPAVFHTIGMPQRRPDLAIVH